MSAHISEQNFQYVGILNGVVYRIDPTTGRSVEPLFGSQPFKTWADEVGNEASAQIGLALATVSAEPAVVAAPVAEAPHLQRDAAPSNLFPRSGAEPLRAGHPNLWALLVAGTCLEGTEYSAI